MAVLTGGYENITYVVNVVREDVLMWYDRVC